MDSVYDDRETKGPFKLADILKKEPKEPKEKPEKKDTKEK